MQKLIKDFSIFIFCELMVAVHQITEIVAFVLTVIITTLALPVLIAIRIFGLFVRYFGVIGFIAIDYLT